MVTPGSGAGTGPAARGPGSLYRLYTVAVFVLLASLDNAAIAVLPPLYRTISADLGVSQGALGLVTATVLLLTAITAVYWGYRGDRGDRKRLLLLGTGVWVVGMAGSGFAGSYPMLFLTQVVAAAGLGAVASIGFSVVSDLISPRRRGLAMSFWGLSQGVGTFAGGLLGGLLGAEDWHRPFWLLAGAGAVAAFAYLVAYDTPRGAREPELAGLFAEGAGYQHRISRSDLGGLARRRTNVWLVAQGFTAQFGYGSLVWLPALFQAKVEAQGYEAVTATRTGALFAGLFQLGAVLSVVGGWLGDRWQRRTPRGRALLSMIGILGAVPFFCTAFFLPLRVDVPADAGVGGQVVAVLSSLVTEPTVGLTFLVALIALALTSADSPNWFALIGDVNLPEHRGTVYAAGNLVNGVGRSLGNGLVGVTFAVLAVRLPPPLNYAVGLALFQAFFLPTGWCYWRAARSSPGDIAEVRATLRARGDAGRPSEPSSHP